MSQQNVGYTRLGTWMILALIVAINLVMSPFAAGAKSVRRERASWSLSSPSLHPSWARSQQDEQDDNDDTRVRTGKRVRRGALPSTGPTLAPWLIPLVTVALGLMSVGITLLVRLNELSDEIYLVGMEQKGILGMERPGRKARSVLRSARASGSLRATRTESEDDWQLRGSGHLCKAWEVMGHRSQHRPIRVHRIPW
jgi:hypothetical protein